MKIKVEPTRDFKKLAKLNETVQKLHNKLYPTEFKPFDLSQAEKALERLLQNPDVYGFIASDGEQSIGYLLCFIQRRLESEFQFEKSVLNIDQVSVQKEYQNKMVAQHLIDAAILLANELNILEIQLDYWEGNLGASKFFAKNGFRYFNHRMSRKN